MGANTGRKRTLEWNGQALGGAREKSATFNAAPIDITDANSNGYQQLLEVEDGDDSDQESIEFSVSGIVVNDILKTAMLTRTGRHGDLVYRAPNGAVISGRFRLSAYSEADPYNGPSTYDATFQSSGAWSFTVGT